MTRCEHPSISFLIDYIYLSRTRYKDYDHANVIFTNEESRARSSVRILHEKPRWRRRLAVSFTTVGQPSKVRLSLF